MSPTPANPGADARLNVRARKSVADEVGGVPIEAIVAFSHLSGAGAASDGVVRGGSSILGGRYAVERGIDLDDRRLRADLLQSWCALTAPEVVFCKPNPWSVRPRPGRLVARFERVGTTLRWAEIVGLSTVSGMVHLQFPDGSHLLTGILIRNRLRKKSYDDEFSLFIQAFGDAATEIVLPDSMS